MTTLSFLFVGAVLFVNGVSLTGRLAPRAAAGLNLVFGLLLSGSVVAAVLPLRGDVSSASLDAILSAGGLLLFAIAYLYFTFNELSGADHTGLGWYSGWATVMSVFLSAVNYVRFDDPRMGTLWATYVWLWIGFFIVFALGRTEYGWGTGWISILIGLITVSLPGALMALGAWADVPAAVVTVGGIAIMAVFLALLVASPRRAAAPAEPQRL